MNREINSGVTAPGPAKLNKRYRNILRRISDKRNLSEFRCNSVINRDVGRLIGRLPIRQGQAFVVVNDTCQDRSNSDLLVVGTEYGTVTIHQITSRDDKVCMTSNKKAKFIASYDKNNSYLTEAFPNGQILTIDEVEEFVKKNNIPC